MPPNSILGIQLLKIAQINNRPHQILRYGSTHLELTPKVMLYVRLVSPHFYRSFTFLPLISTSNRYSTAPSSHYDALGISPKATQAEVKAAYYDQSKIYHPDKNDGSESAARKFRAISEAYEILGNLKLRRLYDKGFLQLSTTDREYKDDPSVNFYRSRRNRPPPPSGKTPIYDFDEWSKSHYGATFAKDMRIKERKRKEEVLTEYNATQKTNEQVLFGVLAGFIFMMYMLSDHSSKHDTVLQKPFEK